MRNGPNPRLKKILCLPLLLSLSRALAPCFLSAASTEEMTGRVNAAAAAGAYAICVVFNESKQ